MFPAWIWMSSVWLAFATLGLVAMFTRDWLGLKGIVTTDVTHDLGKLLLAFCMFWAYTAYAQILPIWYANMPEETDYLLVRIMLPAWGWLAQRDSSCSVCHWLCPAQDRQANSKGSNTSEASSTMIANGFVARIS